MKNLNSFCSFCILSSLYLSLGTKILARDVPILIERVTDEANIFSVEDTTKIREKVLQIEEKTSAQIFIYVIPSLEGDNLESYSIAVAQKSGIGQKGKDNGILVLLSTGDRKVRIEVGYGLEGTLTDVYCNRIIKNIMIPLFKQGDFASGVSEGVEAIISILLGDIDSNPNLSNEYPDGLKTIVFSEENFENHSVIGITVSLFAFIVYFFLREWSYFKTNQKLKIGYVMTVILGLLVFAWSMVALILLLALLALNFYLLYFFKNKHSYLFSFLSLLIWIPIVTSLFNSDLKISFLFVSIASAILFLFKIFTDENVQKILKKLAKNLNTKVWGLFFHFLSLAALVFFIYLCFLGYPLSQSFTIFGLLLLTIYGFGYDPVGYRFKYYLIGIGFIMLTGAILFALANPYDASQSIEFESLVNFFQVYLFIIPPFLIAINWRVETWKIRSLKYAVIAIIWTATIHIPNLLYWDGEFKALGFFVFYGLIFVLHFFIISVKESGYGGGTSSSSYSSGGRSSSSSSSSSGGGGGSFGGGGSSGSW